MASRATEQPEQGSKARGKKSEDPRPGNDANETQPIPVQGISRWLRDCDKNPKLPIVPSAKTTAIKDVILRWRIEAPDDKIIGKSINSLPLQWHNVLTRTDKCSRNGSSWA